MQVGNSYLNESEAFSVVNKVQRLIESGLSPDSITVLTLYEEQRRLIKEFLSVQNDDENIKKTLSRIRVMNVDAFQGRENRVIILSLVRSNDSGKIGFARFPNRLNVALSRAQELLMIVGNRKVFEDHPSQLWTNFLKLLDKAVTIRE